MRVLRYLGDNIFVFFLSILSPVLGIFVSFSNCCSRKQVSFPSLFLLFVTLALWLSAINATKIPASDQIAYANMYYNVPDYSFFEALKFLSYTEGENTDAYNEPVYKAFCWLGYYITCGKVYWYFALITFIIYLTSFVTIYRLLSYVGYNVITILTSIILCAFFFQFVNQTNHAIRQYMAGLIVVYAMVKKTISNKNPWILYLLAALMHKSTLLLLLFLMIPTKYAYDKRKVIVLSIVAVLFSYFLSNISSAMMLIAGEESYVLAKAASESKEFNEMNKIILYGVSMPILYVCYRGLLFRPNVKENSILYFYLIVTLFTLFVMACGKNTLFQCRYFFYIYFLVPYTIPLLFSTNMSISKSFQKFLCLFFPFHFLYSFYTCIWEYAEVYELLLYPLPLLFNYQY